MGTNHQLAINGGTAAIAEPIPAWPPTDPAIAEVIRDALEDGSWGCYEGPWTEQLVEQLQDQFQVAHATLCSSGTIAVELALRGLAVGPDQEVILAGYDFPGNFRAIEAVGAFPVLADVVPGGWVLDPQQVAEAISPSTAAVIVSHLHGQVADLVAIREVCQSAGVSIIEDVCQMPGGWWAERPLGSLGDVAVISFGGSKLLTCGRGGALLTASIDIHQRIRIYSNRGNEAFPLSQLQAAAVSPQLSTLSELNELRARNAQRLIEATCGQPFYHPLHQVVDSVEVRPAFYKLPWLIDDVNSEWPRPDFIRAIQAEGVPIDVGFRGFMRRTARRCRHVGPLLNSRIAAQQTVLLHHPALLGSDKLIESIATAMSKFAS